MGWKDIGQTRDGNSGTSNLVKLEGQTRIRLLLTGGKTQGEPDTYWTYAMSAPDNGYRTWVSPPPEEDFFKINTKAFRPRAIHVGVVWDYATNTAKILEAGNQVWEEILKFINAGINVMDCDLMITKTGTGRDTSYSVVYYQPTPSPFDGDPGIDLGAIYGLFPSYEEVLADLRSMGFTEPEQLFTPQPTDYNSAVNVKVPFGKHKDKTLMEVFNTDTQYLDFLSTKIDREDIKQSARAVSNQLLRTSYELEGICPGVDAVAFTAPTQGAPAQAIPTQQMAPPAPGQAQVADPVVHIDPATGTVYHLINNEWVVQPPAPPAVPAPPAPPAVPAPPAPPAVPAPPAPPAPIGGRDQTIADINNAFENRPEYKDFTLIISKMKEATAPNGKTSIGEFTDEELNKLLSII